MLSLAVSLALMGLQDSPLDRVGPHSEIYESYNDCFAATKGGALNQAVLKELGWSASTSDKDGPVFFSRRDRAPLLMVNGDGKTGICVVMAAFKNVSSMSKFLGAWGDGLPEFEDGQLTFFAEGHPVIFKQAGNQKKPRLNLVVGLGPENKE